MKAKKLIKTIASVSTMGMIGGGMAIGISSCDSINNKPAPSIHFATFNDLKIGDKIYEVQFPEVGVWPVFTEDKVIAFGNESESNGFLSLEISTANPIPKMSYRSITGGTTTRIEISSLSDYKNNTELPGIATGDLSTRTLKIINNFAPIKYDTQIESTSEYLFANGNFGVI